MARKVLRRPRARQDLIEQSRYLAQEADLDTALSFLARCEIAFSKLAERPGIGSPYITEHASLESVRMSPVDGFRSILVFYQEVPGGIRILRVLHTRRDLPGILEDNN